MALFSGLAHRAISSRSASVLDPMPLHQNVALDIVRGPKATPIHELERKPALGGDDSWKYIDRYSTAIVLSKLGKRGGKNRHSQ
jgi:hypothetical protein